MKMTLSKFWRTTMNSTLNISQKALMCPTFYYEKSSLFLHYALKKAFRTLGHFISTITPREREKIYYKNNIVNNVSKCPQGGKLWKIVIMNSLCCH